MGKCVQYLDNFSTNEPSDTDKKRNKQSNQNISDFGVALESKNTEDSFEKYYSKELDLEEDEVPIVLHELSDSALNYIAREQYDKALMLLQKSQSILEKTRSDRYIILVILHNMAMCYQKMGALEECALCIEGCLININSTFLNQNTTLFTPLQLAEQKLKKLKFECKAHMQVCALLSQLHKHKEALNHAMIATRISHYLIKDLINLCIYCIEKVYTCEESNDDYTEQNNNQEVSLLERTALRILPILKELESKLIKESMGADWSEQEKTTQSFKEGEDAFGEIDMRSLLGYLNQNEWIWSLNIGNIMQLSPLTLQDISNTSSFETELSRELILEKITFIAVSYFCVSTEYRFLVTSPEEGDMRLPSDRRKDSEFWHGKALEIGCSFLPSECPLVNHILMSYNKHHSPSNHVIQENQVACDEMKVIKPLKGIESNKYQPIIRALPEVDLQISPLLLRLTDFRGIYDGNLQESRVSLHRPDSHLSKLTNHVQSVQESPQIESEELKIQNIRHSRSTQGKQQQPLRDITSSVSSAQGSQPRQTGNKNRLQTSQERNVRDEISQQRLINDDAKINKSELNRLKMFKSNSDEGFRDQIEDTSIVLGNMSVIEQIEDEDRIIKKDIPMRERPQSSKRTKRPLSKGKGKPVKKQKGTKQGRITPDDDDRSHSPLNHNIIDMLNPALVMNINQSIDSNSRGNNSRKQHPKGSSVQSAITSSMSNTRPLSGKKKKHGPSKQDIERLQISSKYSKVQSSRMSQGYKPLKNYVSANAANSHNNSYLVDISDDEKNAKTSTIDQLGMSDISPANKTKHKGSNINSQKYSPKDKLFFAVSKKYDSTTVSQRSNISNVNNQNIMFAKKKSKDNVNKTVYDINSNFDDFRKQIMIGDTRRQKSKGKKGQPTRSGTPGLSGPGIGYLKNIQNKPLKKIGSGQDKKFKDQLKPLNKNSHNSSLIDNYNTRLAHIIGMEDKGLIKQLQEKKKIKNNSPQRSKSIAANGEVKENICDETKISQKKDSLKYHVANAIFQKKKFSQEGDCFERITVGNDSISYMKQQRGEKRAKQGQEEGHRSQNKTPKDMYRDFL